MRPTAARGVLIKTGELQKDEKHTNDTEGDGDFARGAWTLRWPIITSTVILLSSCLLAPRRPYEDRTAAGRGR